MKMIKQAYAYTDTYGLEYTVDPRSVSFFDIETTGLSPDHHMIYLIGYTTFDGNSYTGTFLFNDDARSELAMLLHFTKDLESITHLASYNGDTFDLPFLRKKLKQYEIFGKEEASAALEKLNHMTSLDLYRILKSYKAGLSLQSLKLQNLQEAMHITRTDHTSGKDLIPLYKAYINRPNPATETVLLNHNIDDIASALPLLSICNYTQISAVKPEAEVVSANTLTLSGSLTAPVPFPLHYRTENTRLTVVGNYMEIKFPLYSGELRHYLPNYRDYYYLIDEERIVHKSIGAFVDPDRRTKATKENCYVLKDSTYIEIPENIRKKNDTETLYRSSDSSYIEYIPHSESLQTLWKSVLTTILPSDRRKNCAPHNQAPSH